MKKSALISLIVAAALLVTGGILLFTGLKSADFDFTPEAAEKTYVVNESFNSIAVDTGICDVTFVKTDGTFRAVCPETDRLSYAVIVEDGVLRISAVDMRRWYDFIGVNLGKMEMTVYLPGRVYDTFYVKTDTGDITVPNDFYLNTIDLLSDTGDIEFSAITGGELTVSNSTGDIRIHDTAPTFMDIRLSTGDILLENLPDCGDIRIKSSSGKITATDVTCYALIAQSNTGNTALTNVLAIESLQVTTTTGDIEIESSDASIMAIETDTGDVDIINCDAATVTIATDTGDVTGNFLSPKWFITDTSTGNIRVPSSREGGECRITTDTGDITFF